MRRSRRSSESGTPRLTATRASVWTFFYNQASMSPDSDGREFIANHDTPTTRPHMNIKSVFVGALLISQLSTSYGQANSFIVSPGITLPKDTATQSQLLTALDGFLSQKDKPGKENTYVLKAHLLETSVLLDEMKQVEANNELKKPAFYKCYLTNVAPLSEKDYLIQCSYLGVNEANPVLRASFTILAMKDDGQFRFSSPLRQNSLSWKTEKLGNTVIPF